MNSYNEMKKQREARKKAGKKVSAQHFDTRAITNFQQLQPPQITFEL